MPPDNAITAAGSFTPVGASILVVFIGIITTLATHLPLGSIGAHDAITAAGGPAVIGASITIPCIAIITGFKGRVSVIGDPTKVSIPTAGNLTSSQAPPSAPSRRTPSPHTAN